MNMLRSTVDILPLLGVPRVGDAQNPRWSDLLFTAVAKMAMVVINFVYCHVLQVDWTEITTDAADALILLTIYSIISLTSFTFYFKLIDKTTLTQPNAMVSRYARQWIRVMRVLTEHSWTLTFETSHHKWAHIPDALKQAVDQIKNDFDQLQHELELQLNTPHHNEKVLHQALRLMHSISDKINVEKSIFQVFEITATILKHKPEMAQKIWGRMEGLVNVVYCIHNTLDDGIFCHMGPRLRAHMISHMDLDTFDVESRILFITILCMLRRKDMIKQSVQQQQTQWTRECFENLCRNNPFAKLLMLSCLLYILVTRDDDDDGDACNQFYSSFVREHHKEFVRHRRRVRACYPVHLQNVLVSVMYQFVACGLDGTEFEETRSTYESVSQTKLSNAQNAAGANICSVEFVEDVLAVWNLVLQSVNTPYGPNMIFASLPQKYRNGSHVKFMRGDRHDLIKSNDNCCTLCQGIPRNDADIQYFQKLNKNLKNCEQDEKKVQLPPNNPNNPNNSINANDANVANETITSTTATKNNGSYSSRTTAAPSANEAEEATETSDNKHEPNVQNMDNKLEQEQERKKKEYKYNNHNKYSKRRRSKLHHMGRKNKQIILNNNDSDRTILDQPPMEPVNFLLIDTNIESNELCVTLRLWIAQLSYQLSADPSKEVLQLNKCLSLLNQNISSLLAPFAHLLQSADLIPSFAECNFDNKTELLHGSYKLPTMSHVKPLDRQRSASAGMISPDTHFHPCTISALLASGDKDQIASLLTTMLSACGGLTHLYLRILVLDRLDRWHAALEDCDMITKHINPNSDFALSQRAQLVTKINKSVHEAQKAQEAQNAQINAKNSQNSKKKDKKYKQNKKNKKDKNVNKVKNEFKNVANNSNGNGMIRTAKRLPWIRVQTFSPPLLKTQPNCEQNRVGRTYDAFGCSIVMFGGAFQSCREKINIKQTEERPQLGKTAETEFVQCKLFADVWIIDLNNRRLSLSCTKSATTPTPRFRHSSVIFNDKLFIIGGEFDVLGVIERNLILNDKYAKYLGDKNRNIRETLLKQYKDGQDEKLFVVFDLKSMQWTVPRLVGSKPTCPKDVAGHCSVLVKNKIFIFTASDKHYVFELKKIESKVICHKASAMSHHLPENMNENDKFLIYMKSFYLENLNKIILITVDNCAHMRVCVLNPNLALKSRNSINSIHASSLFCESQICITDAPWMRNLSSALSRVPSLLKFEDECRSKPSPLPFDWDKLLFDALRDEFLPAFKMSFLDAFETQRSGLNEQQRCIQQMLKKSDFSACVNNFDNFDNFDKTKRGSSERSSLNYHEPGLTCVFLIHFGAYKKFGLNFSYDAGIGQHRPDARFYTLNVFLTCSSPSPSRSPSQPRNQISQPSVGMPLFSKNRVKTCYFHFNVNFTVVGVVPHRRTHWMSRTRDYVSPLRQLLVVPVKFAKRPDAIDTMFGLYATRGTQSKLFPMQFASTRDWMQQVRCSDSSRIFWPHTPCDTYARRQVHKLNKNVLTQRRCTCTHRNVFISPRLVRKLAIGLHACPIHPPPLVPIFSNNALQNAVESSLNQINMQTLATGEIDAEMKNILKDGKACLPSVEGAYYDNFGSNQLLAEQNKLVREDLYNINSNQKFEINAFDGMDRLAALAPMGRESNSCVSPTAICTCDHCGQLDTQRNDYKKCSQCGVASYCSETCQHLAWEGHRHSCMQRKVSIWNDKFGDRTSDRYKLVRLMPNTKLQRLFLWLRPEETFDQIIEKNVEKVRNIGSDREILPPDAVFWLHSLHMRCKRKVVTVGGVHYVQSKLVWDELGTPDETDIVTNITSKRAARVALCVVPQINVIATQDDVSCQLWTVGTELPLANLEQFETGSRGIGKCWQGRDANGLIVDKLEIAWFVESPMGAYEVILGFVPRGGYLIASGAKDENGTLGIHVTRCEKIQMEQMEEKDQKKEKKEKRRKDAVTVDGKIVFDGVRKRKCDVIRCQIWIGNDANGSESGIKANSKRLVGGKVLFNERDVTRIAGKELDAMPVWLEQKHELYPSIKILSPRTSVKLVEKSGHDGEGVVRKSLVKNWSEFETESKAVEISGNDGTNGEDGVGGNDAKNEENEKNEKKALATKLESLEGEFLQQKEAVRERKDGKKKKKKKNKNGKMRWKRSKNTNENNDGDVESIDTIESIESGAHVSTNSVSKISEDMVSVKSGNISNELNCNHVSDVCDDSDDTDGSTSSNGSDYMSDSTEASSDSEEESENEAFEYMP